MEPGPGLVPVVAVQLSMDQPSHREMSNQLISELYKEDDLSQGDIRNAYDVLLRQLS